MDGYRLTIRIISFPMCIHTVYDLLFFFVVAFPLSDPWANVDGSLSLEATQLEASSTGPLFTLFVSTWGHWHVSILPITSRTNITSNLKQIACWSCWMCFSSHDSHVALFSMCFSVFFPLSVELACWPMNIFPKFDGYQVVGSMISASRWKIPAGMYRVFWWIDVRLLGPKTIWRMTNRWLDLDGWIGMDYWKLRT